MKYPRRVGRPKPTIIPIWSQYLCCQTSRGSFIKSFTLSREIFFFFEEDPTDVGMEKTAGYAVGVIIVVVDMLVVAAMVGTPVEG